MLISGIESEIVAEAEPVEVVSGLTLGVARTGHLLALKVLARDDVRRPLDIGDLRALLRVASDAELARARSALALIVERGYHRSRNLMADFDDLLSTRDQVPSPTPPAIDVSRSRAPTRSLVCVRHSPATRIQRVDV